MHSHRVQALAGVWQAACHRAHAVWPRLQALSQLSWWLPHDEALRLAAENVYFDANHDVAAYYDSPEDYAQEVLHEVFSRHFKRENLGSVATWRVQPFLQPHASVLRNAGRGGLSPRNVQDFQALKHAAQSVSCFPAWAPHKVQALDLLYVARVAQEVAKEEAPPQEPGLALTVSAANPESVLCRFYHQQALIITNALRELRLALSYIERALLPDGSAQAGLSLSLKTECWQKLLHELKTLTDLAFEPALPAHFGSDTEQQLRLKVLGCPKGLESLLKLPA